MIRYTDDVTSFSGVFVTVTFSAYKKCTGERSLVAGIVSVRVNFQSRLLMDFDWYLVRLLPVCQHHVYPEREPVCRQLVSPHACKCCQHLRVLDTPAQNM